jgi:hypothetical protein
MAFKIAGSNALDLAIFPGMSKRHSETLQNLSNTATTQEVIWKVVDEVWGRTSSSDVARAFIQAYRVMGTTIAEGGNNHWLQNGGPHFNLRRDYVDTLARKKSILSNY